MKPPLFRSLLLMALPPLAACNMACSGVGLFSATRRYSTAFANDTNVMYDDVQATRADNGVLWAIAGFLSAGAEKMSSDVTAPIPTQVLVSWKTPDGQAHEQRIDVAGNVPNAASFTGGIWFVFTARGVNLVHKPESDWLSAHRGPMADVPNGTN